MMPKSPVSVVIPTYNRSRSVINAINSVLDKTREAAELIVVDDGSSDGTQAILRDYFGSDIRLIRQENRGVSAARNAGIRNAKLDLTAFMDSDDLWTPEKLERQLTLMNSADVVLSATNWSFESSAFLAFDELNVDEQQLTLANDLFYRRSLTPLTLEFLYETYIRASDHSIELQRRLGKLLGYFLRNHAEHLLLDGKNWLARRRAVETLAATPRFKDALAALAVLIFPPAVYWKYRRMAKGDNS